VNSISAHDFDFPMLNPIIAALDVDSAEQCFQLAELLKGRVGALKVGPRLVVRYGAELVLRLAQSAPVFLDNKYLDIPSTMEGAIRASFDAGATLTTIHAWSGREAMERLANVERELNAQRPFKILAVTILTSYSVETLPPSLKTEPIAGQVDELADLTLSCGLSGLVCSPHEVESLRKKSAAAFLVTPGVRMASDKKDDQKRVETPSEAMRKGASALVIGRPIIESRDPGGAVEEILSHLRSF
jgi:orotidine-5'-phosphate decarboxylase